MTSYDPLRDHAAELLERLTSLLADESLQQSIDEPVDDAAAGFKCPETAECTQAQFHQTIAQFLCHVREQVLTGSKAPPWGEVLGEAMALLEEGYRGTYSDSYYGALHDALDPSFSGLEMVLERMAGAIKTRWRETYTRWVIARYVAAADWEVRCALAAILIERCRELLPPELLRCPAEQLEGSVPDLLTIYLGMTKPIHSGASGLFGTLN